MYQQAIIGEPKKITIKRPRRPKSFAGCQHVGDVLMYGGELQSTTILMMMLLGQLPKPRAVIYADTGDEAEAMETCGGDGAFSCWS
jgi:hypothetical protein